MGFSGISALEQNSGSAIYCQSQWGDSGNLTDLAGYPRVKAAEKSCLK
jgi:hypothetical protein